jgi:hypothetical protein
LGASKLGDNPENIDPAALLELESTTKGLLLPRMTSAQRDALPMDTSPVGLLIYNTDIDEIQSPFDMHQIGVKKRGVISVKKQRLFERSEFFCFRRGVHFFGPRAIWPSLKTATGCFLFAPYCIKTK